MIMPNLSNASFSMVYVQGRKPFFIGIYEEEIESTSARFLLMKFFTFIYVLERRYSLLDRAFV
jgi:hypothetical protein